MRIYPRPKEVIYSSDRVVGSVLKRPFYQVNNCLEDQEYILHIRKKEVLIEYSGDRGRYYADLTLAQIVPDAEGMVPLCQIHDRPDFENRCVLIDVGRNHVPTLETLYHVIDLLSKLRINQLQLYFEGFPFAYKSHPQVWKNKDVMTGEDLQKLDTYCKAHFIELVPTVNAFGHMKHWLARDEFKMLGIEPEDSKGFLMPWGYERGISTLDPEKEGSWELTKSLFDDLLPYFTSKLINICCDETFELEEKRKLGKNPGKLYFDYLIKIYSYIKEQYPDRNMMFWGDIVEQHPEYLPQLPEDMIPILWRYDINTPTLEQCRIYENTGRNFYVACSAKTECTIVGDMDTAMGNADCCAVHGKATGAKGYMITRWQDLGGWDETSTSYPAFVYGGMRSWNADVVPEIEGYLNEYVYQDVTGKMAEIAINLGRFKQWESWKDYYNGNGILKLLYYHQLNDTDHDLDFLHMPDYEPDYFEKVEAHIKRYEEMLNTVWLQCEDRDLILQEYRLLIRILLHGVALGKYKQKGVTDRMALWELYDDIQTIIADYRAGWLKRNRNINIENSVYKFYQLQEQYQHALGVERVKV